ncbi:hypothetical protein CVT26_015904 [Gymnopilus dilepis]|uniref:Uncharacterized protein n=1 Tax=Gymnopilus dilepis TaxID=231916 RepID=A0A409WHL8_9AGAR|nr:hypothetical protein CVT26_015904 [Gymnopilus dilepis]
MWVAGKRSISAYDSFVCEDSIWNESEYREQAGKERKGEGTHQHVAAEEGSTREQQSERSDRQKVGQRQYGPSQSTMRTSRDPARAEKQYRL